MIPILYPSNTISFDGNGLGFLVLTETCKCTEVLNSSYEIELKVSKDDPHASGIIENAVIMAKPNYEDPPQPFRIYSIQKKNDDFISVKAAHISYDTSGIPVLPFTSENLDTAVDNLNENRMLLEESGFVLNADFSADGTLTVEVPTSFRSLLGGSENSLVEVYGGEYHYDAYTINLVQQRGRDKGVCFRYGKNISKFEQEVDTQDFYTAVFGYWKKDDSIVYSSIIQCGAVFPYNKIYILDASDKSETEPTVDQLDEYVIQYISSNAVGIPKNSMKIDYTDDDRIIQICLGDRVSIFYPEYGIYATARCNKVVFDCLNERNESIEIGVVSTDLSDTILKLSTK